MNNNLNKYLSVESSSISSKDLMGLVLEKAINYMRLAKNNLIEKNYIEQGRNIYKVVQILEVLCKTVTVKEDIPGSKEVFKMYENLMFMVENLVAKKAPAADYDFFIEYFENLKSQLLVIEAQNENHSVDDSVKLQISEQKEEQVEEEALESHFNEEGRFELVT